MLSGLDHHQADALGDGPGDHARAGAAYLTGVHCKKTGGTDIRCGISVDQIAAQKLPRQTRFPSLELGCDDTRTVGACDSGYSCAYQNTLSWRTETSPLPPETNPRAVFERLFGAGDLNLPADVRARARRRAQQHPRPGSRRYTAPPGEARPRRPPQDRRVPVRRPRGRKAASKARRRTTREYAGMIEKPAGVPVLFKDYLKVMFDLQILALQGDLTRVITMMYGREGSQRTYGEIGIPEPHHPLTHHRGNPEWIEKFTPHQCLSRGELRLFPGPPEVHAGWRRLAAGSLGVGLRQRLSDPNAHSKVNLPTVLVGRANGQLQPGRHIVYPKGTPMANLFMTLLSCMDVHPESIGDSTGKLEHLADL